MSGNRLFGG